MPSFISLSRVLDRITDSDFYNDPIKHADKKDMAQWIISRQGQKYSYGSLYSLTEKDKKEGLVLFTGERISFGAKARHVAGEEALRALKVLNLKLRTVSDSIDKASSWMEDMLNRHGNTGHYCCKGCSTSVWRTMAADVYPDINKEEWIIKAVGRLKSWRQPGGRWKSYPFYYTIFSLMEYDNKEVANEMKFAFPVLEKVMKAVPKNIYQQRRRDIAERVLNKY